jgi:hypothetical protein
VAEREYIVSGYLTIGVSKIIRARSKKHARELAQDLNSPRLCYQCASAGEEDDDCWELNGFDEPPDDCVRDVEVVW